jgi:hypothetical protein
VPVPVPAASVGRAAKYVSDAMTRIADDLASRDPGGRNAAAYAAGLKTGSLLGAARVTPGAEHAAWTDEQAEQALLDAAQRNGYASKDGEAEALRAIARGRGTGCEPRGHCPTSPLTGRHQSHRRVRKRLPGQHANRPPARHRKGQPRR